MIYFKLIFINFLLFAFNVNANDVQIIELHQNKSLDQLVLEKENNENKLDENKSTNIQDKDNIIEDGLNLEVEEGSNTNTDNIDEQITYIENETFFDLDNSVINLHLEKLKEIKSKAIHHEFIKVLSNLDFESENTAVDKLNFVIKKLYEIGEIEKAYKLITKINLENTNIDNKYLEFFYLVKLNYLYSSYKLSEACELRSFLIEQSFNLPKNLLQKSDIFCLTLENNFSEAKLLNSLLIESELEKDENFQKLFNFMLFTENDNSLVQLGNIQSNDLIFLYSAMLRINELPLDRDFIDIDPLNLSIPVILSESTSMDVRIKAAHKAYEDGLISIDSLSALYQSVDFNSKQFDDPSKTISNIKNNELIMAYYYQLANIQIFPDERLNVVLDYFNFAKKSGLENIAYAITEKIIETFTPVAEISEVAIEIAFANIANNNFDGALKWLSLYELSNPQDKMLYHANFLIDLNQNDDLDTVINYLSDSNLNFDQINTQSSKESLKVLIDFLQIENISNNNFPYSNISDDRVMPSYFLIHDIKKHIIENKDLSVFFLTLISMHNKSWTELHPEHLKLALEAMNLYDNGSLKKQIIIEILNELKIF